LGGRAVYISIDVDVIDPLFFSSVDAPISGGLMPQQLLSILSDLGDCRLVGADVTAFNAAVTSRPLELMFLSDLLWTLSRLRT
jgi:agmatinase